MSADSPLSVSNWVSNSARSATAVRQGRAPGAFDIAVLPCPAWWSAAGLPPATACRRPPVRLLTDHHLGGLDDHGHPVAILQVQVLAAGVGDDCRDRARIDVDGDLGHYRAGLHALNGPGQLIARTDLHGCLLSVVARGTHG